ncbi:MAG TPA: GGDEF domain-containing protein [Sphingomicrobium sp.]|nr:GGDEF domain-containing protein [Sphingomicrobium sp.]HET9148919.1 GGDEF domain-containing protein [Alphaproteobacteria bacterium]
MSKKARPSSIERRADDVDLVARLGGLAARLQRANRRAETAKAPLVEQALEAAAEVERRLVAQHERIAYLEALSITDELTGLLNRRGFDEALRRALMAASRYGDEGVLLVCDIDDFKNVNDCHGHAAGDLALRDVGSLLKAQVRETDFVARLGGDEFALILVQTGWRNALKRAQAISRALNRLTVGKEKIAIRASIGIERFGPNDADARILLARADMTMYCNKRRKGAITLAHAAE